MRAISYDRPGHWELVELPDPVPAAGEVVLRVILCGVCGTDLHLDRGEFGPTYPLTPGHEIVGEVAAAGAGVETLAVGDRVALDNMTACGMCRQCQRGRPQFCDRMTALGLTHPGGFADYVVVPAGKCHLIADLEPDVAVFAEPLACVVHGIDVLAPAIGVDALVIGTGPTGLLLTQMLRITGAARVVVAGRTAAKLALAAADETVSLDAAGLDGAADRLRALAPHGFDVIVDATGSVDVLNAAAGYLGIGGTLFVYGMAPETAQLAVNPYDVFRRELVIRGSFSQAFSVERAVALLRSGRIRTAGLISRRFGLDEYAAGLDAVANDPSCVKAVIAP